MTIQSMKTFDGFARFGKVQSAVGQDPIDIEENHANALRLEQ
jgi:hypothetical protein